MNTEQTTQALALHKWVIANVISDIDCIDFDPHSQLFAEGLAAASEATADLIEALRAA